MSTKKLNQVEFSVHRYGEKWFTLFCDLRTGTVSLTSVPTERIKYYRQLLAQNPEDLDSLHAIERTHDFLCNQRQFHQAKLEKATLENIEDGYPFSRFKNLKKKLEKTWFIDDTHRYFRAKSGDESISLLGWGPEDGPIFQLFLLIRRASGFNRHPEWW